MANKEHLEMILFDSKCDSIKVIISTHLVENFKFSLNIGNTYIMQNFKVGQNDFSFKVTPHKWKLMFYNATSTKTIDIPDILKNYLNLICLSDILSAKFGSDYLYDVIGGVNEIIQTQLNSANNKSKVVFTILDMRFVVHCTLWGELTLQFYNYYINNNEKDHVTVLLQNARIKPAEGSFSLIISNAWDGTKLCINDLGIPKIKKFKERYKLEVQGVDGKHGARFIFWDSDCVKLIGKSAKDLKSGDDDPLEYPYALDKMLKKELAIRVVYQSNIL